MQKLTLNTALVFRALAACVLLGTATHLVHAWQLRRHARDQLALADRALEQNRLTEAVGALSRSFAFAPEADVHARYALTLARWAQGPAARGRALEVLKRVVSRQPNRADLRRQTAELALSLGQFDEARRHLLVLLRDGPAQGDLEALLGRCETALGEVSRAATTLQGAIRHEPGRLESYVLLAELLRYRLDQPRRAETVLEALVRDNPRRAAAYLLRARFRAAAGAPGEAETDLAVARRLAPDDVAILTASGEVARQRGRAGAASAYYREALRRAPREVSLYLSRAEVEVSRGRNAEAVACLRAGLRELPEQPDLLFALADLLVEQGESSEATRVTRAHREVGDPARARYLDGRALMAAGRWVEAAAALEEASRAPNSRAYAQMVGEDASRLQLNLARCYAGMGLADRRLGACRLAVAYSPGSAAARLELGRLLVGAGQLEEALTHLRALVKLPRPPATVWVLLARALVRHNLRLPAQQRDWAEAERALGEETGRTPSQVAEAAALRAEILRVKEGPEAARDALEKAREQQPEEVVLWQALLELADRGGDAKQTEELLREAGRRLNDRVEWLLVRADRAARGGPDAHRELAALEGLLDRLPGADGNRLARRLAEVYHRRGAGPAVARLCRRLLSRHPAEMRARLMLLDVALAGGDDAAARREVAGLRQAEGAGGTCWRYGEAARLVARAIRGERDGLARVRELLAEVRQSRPYWERVPLLEARVGELEGRPDQALRGYLTALELGAFEPSVVQRAVALLVAQGRAGAADRLVSQAQARGALGGRDYLRPAAEIALRARNFDHAAELARLAVSRDTAPYRDQLWLGQVLAACGRDAEATVALERAVRQAPDSPEAWLTLLTHLGSTGQGERADAALEEMKARVPAALLALTRARGQEALARFDRAEAEYRRARAERPHEALVLRRLADFYLRLDRPAEASEVLRSLLDPRTAIVPEEIPEVRRQLALTLSADGRAGGEAQKLLDQNRGGGATEELADRRTRLLVRAQQPGERRAALRELESLLKGPPLPASEQLRLARLYEADGDWGRARERLLGLVARDGQNPAYLAALTDGLLKRDDRAEARPWLERLARVEPATPRTRGLRERLLAPASRKPGS